MKILTAFLFGSILPLSMAMAEGEPHFIGRNYIGESPAAGAAALDKYSSSEEVVKARGKLIKDEGCSEASSVSVLLTDSNQALGGGTFNFLIVESLKECGQFKQGSHSLIYSVETKQRITAHGTSYEVLDPVAVLSPTKK